METKRIPVQPRIFRSWLAPAAFGLCVLAVVLAAPSVIKLTEADYRQYLLQDLIDGGIGSGSALKTYLLLEQILLVAAPVLTAGMAACLAVTLFGHPADGLGALGTAAQVLEKALNVLGVLLAGGFVLHFLRYTIACLMANGGVYLLYAMVISEALMAALAALLFFTLRRFVSCLCDSAASMAYTLTAGELTGGTVPSFAGTGFFMLAVFCLVVAVDQMLTVTIVQDVFHPYYKLLVSPHPAQWAAAASFVCCGAADVLLGCYLRRYQAISEKCMFQARQRVER